MSLNARNTVEKIINKFYWRQHPEAALRYWPVVAEIKKAHLADSKILEIGSGSLGIIPYFKKSVSGLDIDFSGPQTKLLKKIKGEADKLPFGKNTYDVSISVDVLEHLESARREKAIFEQLRVAKKMALIVVPCGAGAQEQDAHLYKKWNKTFKVKNQFLQEHVRNQLPKKEEILVSLDRSLRKLNKKANIRSYPNLNLHIRYILMSTYISKNKLFYYLYLKGYLILVPILKYCNFGRAYRRVFVIEFAS